MRLMTYLLRFLKNPKLQAAVMSAFNLAVIFEYISWSDAQVSAVNVTIGLWILIARETFEKDLAQLQLATEDHDHSV